MTSSDQADQAPFSSTSEEESQFVSPETVLQVLANGEIEVLGTLPWGSNYTFLATVTTDQLTLHAVYKPCSGERPLWDFADGTLCQREMASYVLSQALGWPLIPPSVFRQGPYGRGTVQFFIDADPDAHYFTLRHDPKFRSDFQRIAVFDFIINNADRKSGHCLKDSQDRIWAIDHGLTFHTEPKLRTVIWEYCERPLPEDMLADLRGLQQLLLTKAPPLDLLPKLIAPVELAAVQERLDCILRAGLFPTPRSGRNIPFPPV